MSDMDRRKKKKSNPLLPIMGLALAVLLGIVAYFVAPMALEFARDQSADLDKQVSDFEKDPQGGLPAESFEYVFAAVIWLVSFSLVMFITAAAIGEDPEKESVKMMGPSPANKKAVAKDLKKRIRAAKKRERERQRRDKANS